MGGGGRTPATPATTGRTEMLTADNAATNAVSLAAPYFATHARIGLVCVYAGPAWRTAPQHSRDVWGYAVERGRSAREIVIVTRGGRVVRTWTANDTFAALNFVGDAGGQSRFHRAAELPALGDLLADETVKGIEYIPRNVGGRAEVVRWTRYLDGRWMKIGGRPLSVARATASLRRADPVFIAVGRY